MAGTVLKIAVSFLIIGGVLYRFGVTGWGLVFGYLIIIGVVVVGLVVFARMEKTHDHSDEIVEEWGDENYGNDEGEQYNYSEYDEYGEERSTGLGLDESGDDTYSFNARRGKGVRKATFEESTQGSRYAKREMLRNGGNMTGGGSFISPDILKPLAKTLTARVEGDVGVFFEELEKLWIALQENPHDRRKTINVLTVSTMQQIEGLNFLENSEAGKDRRRKFVNATFAEGNFPEGVGKKELIDAFHFALYYETSNRKPYPPSDEVEEFVSAQLCTLATILRQFNVSAVESLKTGLRLSQQ